MGNEGVEAVWAEWGRLTRFLISTRTAYTREIQDLRSFRGNTTVSADGPSIPLSEYLAALADTEILHASVLFHTYALAEAAAAAELGTEVRHLEGIEVWGNELLTAAGASWDEIDGGKLGAVEAAVARNAVAHGSRRVDSLAAKRLRKAGSTESKDGDVIELDYETVQRHRKRLKLLLNAGGIRRSPAPQN